MCMLRHRRRTQPDLPMRLIYSARTRPEVIYADELGDDAIVALTRELEGVPVEGLSRVHRGHIFPGLIAAESFPMGLAFVCGSDRFVEPMTDMLLAAGYSPDRIRTERFGPTG
jgi:ferredoxin-NADP reductase